MFEPIAVRFNLSPAKFLLMISTDDGALVFILLFIGFNVETDVGINESSVPNLDFRNAFRALRFEGSDLVRFRTFLLQQSFDG